MVLNFNKNAYVTDALIFHYYINSLCSHKFRLLAAFHKPHGSEIYSVYTKSVCIINTLIFKWVDVFVGIHLCYAF